MTAKSALIAAGLVLVAGQGMAQQTGRMGGPESAPNPNQTVEPVRVLMQIARDETSWQGGR